MIDCDGGGKGGSAKVTGSYGIFSTKQILQSTKLTGVGGVGGPSVC